MNMPESPPTLREQVLAGLPVRLVTYTVRERWLGTHVDHVEEIVSEPRIHPMPDSPPHLVGLLALRGELLPVIDLGPAIGLEPTPRPDVVVLLSVADRRFGLAVDDIGQIVDVAASDVHLTGEREAGGVLAGFARRDRAVLALVEPVEILTGLRSLMPQELL
jgi:chemotaxis signal transduction protein